MTETLCVSLLCLQSSTPQVEIGLAAGPQGCSREPEGQDLAGLDPPQVWPMEDGGD